MGIHFKSNTGCQMSPRKKLGFQVAMWDSSFVLDLVFPALTARDHLAAPACTDNELFLLLSFVLMQRICVCDIH
jgi:hypothetical protein